MKKGKFKICCFYVCSFLMVYSAAMLAAPAVAADYPTRAIRIVNGFAPGGSSDFVTRVIAAKLTDVLGQQVIVDNRPGAGGNVGAEIVAKADPDGYTLFMGTSSICTSPSLYSKLQYDTSRDFTPIIKVAIVNFILTLSPSVAANSVEELIALAKANPGKLTYGSSGVGTPQNLSGALFCNMAGISMLHVPYKGGGPAIVDLLAGRLDMLLGTVATVSSHIESGRLKGIAGCGTKRSTLLPNMPTVSEAGLPGFNTTEWNGLIAPAKTPRPIITRLNAEVSKVLAMPDLKETLLKKGIDAEQPSTPEQFGAFIKSETTKWAKVIKDAGINKGF
ncbi:MAG: tripartite tricarboxylate transporter substrate binding protein [Chloroflexota bacterium]